MARTPIEDLVNKLAALKGEADPTVVLMRKQLLVAARAEEAWCAAQDLVDGSREDLVALLKEQGVSR
jgi:hypothetical protein